MSDNKPKEFWINGGWARPENNFGQYDRGDIIHVIEMSAYKVAIAERDKYKTCYEVLNADYATRTVMADYASLSQDDRKKIDDLMSALKAIGASHDSQRER